MNNCLWLKILFVLVIACSSANGNDTDPCQDQEPPAQQQVAQPAQESDSEAQQVKSASSTSKEVTQVIRDVRREIRTEVHNTEVFVPKLPPFVPHNNGRNNVNIQGNGNSVVINEAPRPDYYRMRLLQDMQEKSFALIVSQQKDLATSNMALIAALAERPECCKKCEKGECRSTSVCLRCWKHYSNESFTATVTQVGSSDFDWALRTKRTWAGTYKNGCRRITSGCAIRGTLTECDDGWLKLEVPGHGTFYGKR